MTWLVFRAWNQMLRDREAARRRTGMYLRWCRDWDNLHAETLRTAAVVAGKRRVR